MYSAMDYCIACGSSRLQHECYAETLNGPLDMNRSNTAHGHDSADRDSIEPTI
jgi:hypothetical protein